MHLRRGDQKPVHLARKQQFGIFPLFIGGFIAVAQKQMVSGLIRGIFHATHHGCPKWIGDVGDDQTESVGAFGAHAGTEAIGHIVEIADRLLDALPQLVADISSVVDDP